MCPNPKCRCQKQLTFTPNEFQHEGAGFNTMKKIFRRNQKACDSFFKPAVDTSPPVIEKAVGAKSKNSKVGQATAKFLKSFSGSKVLNLTDFNGNGLRLKVMYRVSKEKKYSKNEYLYERFI